ncbi:hypothetical protein [Bradyrhizobium sp.]|uniref:hypothetical protein n=1 Tax=Bradyrhizobium sp. TaxID=376 RepID=UPI0023842A18|nr:hypothetical protein [Bradyrhizobium sp.]MDE2378709.1 hypothetical protein [Bradyrhizobium sp.]
MKVFRVAAMLGLLAAPAYAQTMPNINLLQEGPSKTDEEKAADAERDQKYRDTLKKIPDAKASNDPWGGMRADPPKASPPRSPAKSPTKSAATKKTNAN